RKEPEILDLFNRFQPHEIDSARRENLDDVTTYIDAKFNQSPLANLLASSGADPRAVRDLIAARGEGNFLYVTQAVAAIESGQIDPLRPQTFPHGLVGVYRDFFNRVFPRGKDYDSFRPLLDVMIAAREPLSAEQIAEFLELDPFNVRSDLEKVSAFFPEREGVYRAYHKSVVDWLCGFAGRSLTYRVNVEGGHEVISDKLLARYRSGNPDLFMLAHLPAHLILSRRWDDLEAVLTDLRFIEAKSAAAMTYDLIADYRAAIDHLPEFQEDKQREREREERLAVYAQELVSYSRRWNEARKRQATDPEHSLPEPPASNQKDFLPSPRIANARGATRREKIHAFSQFANAQGHSLMRHSARRGFCVQQAYNLMADGPVGEAAEHIVSRGELDSLAFLRRPLTRPRYSPRPTSLCILEGHSGWVTAAAITPDGRLAVSGGVDQSVQVWDVASGQSVKLLKGHSGWIRGAALTADGRRAVSVSSDMTLRIWDIESGAGLRIISGLSDSKALAMTPDGGRAISKGDGRSVCVWDLESGSLVKIIRVDMDEIADAALTPDGRLALLAGGRNLLLCHLDSGESLNVTKGFPVSAVTMAADGRLAVTGGDDNKVRVWDIEGRRCVATLSGHS
ncbi:MAG TPA: WD40 repeat domain-containing protein, partial [Blastocatellia bacterium]